MSGARPAEAARTPQWDRTPAQCGDSVDTNAFRAASNRIDANDVNSVLTDLRFITDPNTDETQLRLAVGDCRDARGRDGRFHIQAFLCLGEASRWPRARQFASADVNPTKAYCAYHSAAILAHRIRNANLETQAHIGRGQTLDDIGASQQAIDAFGLAIRANGSAEYIGHARAALAQHYIRIGHKDEARDALLVNWQPIVGGTDVALALVELAHMQTPQVPPEEQINYLNAARTAAPYSVAVQSALGVGYFKAGRFDLAPSYLQDATTHELPTNEQSYLSLREQAFLYRSVMETGGPSHPAIGGDPFWSSERAGNSAEALRQACLLRIRQGDAGAQGGHGVFHQELGADRRLHEVPVDGAQYCSTERLGTSPEGQLLVGMYWLRHAQFMAMAYGTLPTPSGQSQWQDNITNADIAFRTARNALTDRTQPLNWPMQDQDPTIKLSQMLDAADRLRQFYNGGCQQPNPIGDQAAENIFVFYRVVQPVGAARRCMPYGR